MRNGICSREGKIVAYSTSAGKTFQNFPPKVFENIFVAPKSYLYQKKASLHCLETRAMQNRQHMPV